MTPKEIKYFLTTTTFILTRKERGFLVMSAFETDDQPGTLISNERVYNAKLALSFTM